MIADRAQVDTGIQSSDRARRSIAKAFTYRFGGTVLDLVGVYVVTRKLEVAIGFAIVVNACAVVGYYVHERIWARIQWARGERSSSCDHTDSSRPTAHPFHAVARYTTNIHKELS